MALISMFRCALFFFTLLLSDYVTCISRIYPEMLQNTNLQELNEMHKKQVEDRKHLEKRFAEAKEEKHRDIDKCWLYADQLFEAYINETCLQETIEERINSTNVLH